MYTVEILSLIIMGDEMDEIKHNRDFMKCPPFKDIMTASDQQSGVPHPPHGKQITGELTELPPFDSLKPKSYMDLLDIRRSERVFRIKPVSGEQLAFLLWSAQGIQSYRGADNAAVLRPVPSGGARHPFEMYAAVNNVSGLKNGLYRYAPLMHIGEKKAAVEYVGGFDDYKNQITDMLAGQKWASKAPVVLFLSCVPYRGEWRYDRAAHRVMLIDLGHVGQNIMLSAAAVGLGSCCIAAYDQQLCDAALGFDGTDEYTVYAAVIGEPRNPAV